MIFTGLANLMLLSDCEPIVSVPLTSHDSMLRSTSALFNVTDTPGGMMIEQLPYGTTPSFHVAALVKSPDLTAVN